MVPVLARLLAPALLSLAMVQPLAAQGVESAQAARARDGQGLAMGLMALAAVGILLHERREDREEEREDREEAARRLPPGCLVTWLDQDGGVRLYEPECLDASFEAASRLPLDCAVTVRSEGRFVSGFSPACLREEGWLTGE